MAQIHVPEPVASPFEDAAALVAFLDDLATAQGDGFLAELACPVCGITLTVGARLACAACAT